MNPLHVLGSLSALASAVVWGSSDFSGGLAARRSSQFQVLALASFSGLLALAATALLLGDAWPSIQGALWAVAAGASGGLGIACLYRALALGNAAVVSPTASVIGAAVPVLFELLRRNPPGALQFMGFLLALLGIWLVAQTPGKGSPAQQGGFWLAVVAGLGFGGFFILIRQAAGGVFALLTLSKASGLALALIVLWLRREALPGVGSNPMALFAGVLDAGGNVFYLVATRYTRLDVAAVLSALYPAVTVLLASLLTQEAVTRKQWAGVSACLAAVMLILI